MQFGRLGFGFGRLGAGGTSAGPHPDAPVLTWTSAQTDTTPTFNIDLPSGLGDPHDAIPGDVIYLELTDNASFNSSSTDTLDAGEVSGDIVAMEETTPLSDGTYYARARLKRGSSFGPYSNTETVTILQFTNRAFPLDIGYVATTVASTYPLDEGYLTETA